jgi:predicted DNA binding protein
MRYVETRLVPEDRPIHPFVELIAADPDAHGGYIHQLQQVEEDSMILLTEVFGDLERYRELAAACDTVLDCTLSGEQQAYAHIHLELTELSRTVLDIHRPDQLTFKFPIYFDTGGALVVTLIGDDASFGDTIDHLPEDISVEVQEMGEYAPDAEDVYARLTDRQQEILDVALETGYYDHPREATHGDIADRVDIAPATVGEHLRKIESKVFRTFLDR